MKGEASGAEWEAVSLACFQRKRKLNAPESISRVIICRRAEKAEPLQKTTNKKKKGAGEEVNRMARWCMKVEKAS